MFLLLLLLLSQPRIGQGFHVFEQHQIRWWFLLLLLLMLLLLLLLHMMVQLVVSLFLSFRLGLFHFVVGPIQERRQIQMRLGW